MDKHEDSTQSAQSYRPPAIETREALTSLMINQVSITCQTC